jgi:hypothetical protein
VFFFFATESVVGQRFGPKVKRKKKVISLLLKMSQKRNSNQYITGSEMMILYTSQLETRPSNYDWIKEKHQF